MPGAADAEVLPDPLAEPDLDMDAALADISSGLFDKTPEDGDELLLDPLSKVSGPDVTPPGGAPALSNTSAVQAIGAPETWTKEAITEWATIPERAKQEILKREQDIHKGFQEIQGIRDRAGLGDRYSQVFEPFAPLLAAENLDPVEMVKGFASNHYLLSRGTPDQKLQLATNLMLHYQIDPRLVVERLTNYRPPDPQVVALQSQIGELSNRLSQTDQERATANYNSALEQIKTFSADPAHPYFDELADDIIQLFKTGGAPSLQEAYEKAVWTNPTTRAKEIARQSAAPVTTTSPAANRASAALASEVRVSPSERNGAVPRGSIEDTLTETLARINSRGG